ncbi:transporter [Streptomyces jumonjinensis]|uniref:transporter n=1 Tax=Streptomyces jumonjinensis TaxID=1945 RepID=UPI0037BD9DA9
MPHVLGPSSDLEMGAMGLRLFSTKRGMTEVMPRLADVEADVQGLVEAHMEIMLGVRFLASEYSTGPVHGGRIDSLGLDENGSPVIVEYKRATDAGVIHQGLFYLAWLMDHRTEFQHLVRDRIGAEAAGQILWSDPRVICVAGDFTRYDVHAVREHRRSIDLVRYRLYGDEHIALETIASVHGHAGAPRRRRGAGTRTEATLGHRETDGAMADLSESLGEVLMALGGDVVAVQRKQYTAYRRLRNFVCVPPAQQAKLLAYVKVSPTEVDLVPGFTRDVTGLGHHGTGDLEVQLRSERDLERAGELFRLAYAGA